MQKKFRVLFLSIAILFPIFIGLYVRFDDLEVWKQRQNFYFQERPIFTSYDAFYFARWSKEYLNGTFKGGETDPLRFVPDKGKYPPIIPMESWLGAKLAQLLGTHIENVALWLSPLLSVFFVIPFVFYFYKIGFPLSGFSGALLGVISIVYLTRTSIVRYDTDSLNLFFPFAIALALLNSLIAKSQKLRILNLTIAGILSQLYYWWYLHPGLIIAIDAFYLIALLFEKEKTIKDKFILFLVLLIFSNPLIVSEGVTNFINLAKIYLINVFKPEVSGFPNIHKTIDEAIHFEIARLSEATAGNFFLFAIGFSGLVLLILKKFKELFLLLPVLFIGLMSFFGGSRFIMYLAPFVGAGLGYLAERLLEYIDDSFLSKYRELSSIPALPILSSAILFSNPLSLSFTAIPKLNPNLIRDFIKLAEITPPNSWIWTWWDFGTAIQYYAGRAVYHDGQSQGSPKTYFIATTFTTDNPQIAYNTILGVSYLGASGIKGLLKEGRKPQEIRNLMFSGAYAQPVENPIYWIFTGDEIAKFAAISYLGTWNFEEKRGTELPIHSLYCFNIRADIIKCAETIIDLKNGYLYNSSKPIPIKRVIVKEEKNISELDFSRGKLYVEVIRRKETSYAFLLSKEAYKSLFNQMFILRKYSPKYFEIVYDDFPHMVVYRLKTFKR